MKLYILSILLMFVCCITTSCDKEFLEKKKDKALLVPQSLDDIELLLDNSSQLFNTSPGLQIVSADEFITTEAVLATLPSLQRNSHLWNDDFYEGITINMDWSIPYQQIFYANIAIEALDEMEVESIAVLEKRNVLEGTALFHRSLAYFNIAQLFAANYRPGLNDEDLGIPLKRSSNIHEKLTRATLKETYDLIISDLKRAKDLLPEHVTVLTRPSKIAVNGLLARIYLDISNYDEAESHADLAISHLSLLDYNTVPQTNLTSRLFPRALPKGNPEIAFFCSAIIYNYPLTNTGVTVDPTLYNSFEDADLRKILFFRDLGNNQGVTFRGTYGGTTIASLFSGIALDELMLIKAECLARKGEARGALALLNTLRKNRFSYGGYYDLELTEGTEILRTVLEERKKQLLARGLRWSDLKRLNREDIYSTILRRNLGARQQILLPNDPKYIFPIPQDEILNHGFEQNPR